VVIRHIEIMSLVFPCGHDLFLCQNGCLVTFLIDGVSFKKIINLNVQFC
jgi:hypothetical protein